MSQMLEPQDTCVLVTGGAGFIGSHTVVELLNCNYQVVIVDDLSNASEVAVSRVRQIVGDEKAKNLTFYQANVLDREAMEKIFTDHKIDRVIHFAGFKAVGESVTKPIEYYHNNIENTLVLVDVMRNHGCKSIVFSSTSTVYGDPGASAKPCRCTATTTPLLTARACATTSTCATLPPVMCRPCAG